MVHKCYFNLREQTIKFCGSKKYKKKTIFKIFQLNEISAFIDGTLMYGPNKAWTDALRSYKDGLLAATNDTDPSEGYFPAYNEIRLPFANPPPPRDHFLKPIKRFFSKSEKLNTGAVLLG